jgi:starch-binding outer membrane protein, SusD/RagB family
MYNKILKISAFFFLVALLASCKKELETEPRDLFSDELVWDVKDNNAVYAQQFLANLYNYLPNGLNRFDGDYLESGTDDAVPSRNNTFSVQRYTNGLVSVISNPDGYWGNSYTGIRQVNILLSNIDKVPAIATNIARWKAEARFIRAFLYYELLKRYGGVPLIGDQVFTLTDQLQLPRNTFAQVHDYIVTECDQVKGNLMAAPGADVDWGRPSNGAALALKCRVYLLGASPLFNGGAISSPQASAGLLGFTTSDPLRWQKVIDAAEELKALNYYALQTPLISVFTNKKNAEVIFAKQSANSTTLEVQSTPVGYIVNGVANEGRTSPSQNLVDAFPMLNGIAITDAGSGYNPAAPYTNRDKRLDATIFYNTLRWLNRPVETFNGGLDKPNTNVVQTKTGYYLRKFLGDFTNSSQFSNTSHNFIYFRYAEILLNYAEALNERGRTEDAVQQIIEVRKRASNGIAAGVNNRYGIAAGIAQSAMRTLIQNERRIELAFEEHRFWDLRRWKIAGTVLNGPIRGMDIVRTAPNTFTYNIVQVSATVFTDKLYYMPLPYDETVKNPNLQQNPGW